MRSSPHLPWMHDGRFEDPEQFVEPAIEQTRRWLVAAEADTDRAERASVQRFVDVVHSSDGVAFTTRFVDRVARHRSHSTAARELACLVREDGLPSFLSRLDRILLGFGARLAPRFPRVVMPLARRRLRSMVGHLFTDATPQSMHRELAPARTEGFGINVNRLGEMVLGDAEADRRFHQLIALIDDPEVDYISVKVSSIVSHIDLWSFETTVERIEHRLGELFRRAVDARTATFINLDMEEYRDLGLTVAVFTRLLSEPDLGHVDAGIVLQAYLPDSFEMLEHLVVWSQQRHADGGGRIKIRLVKGANLAMERVEAELHGWTPAPYDTKAEVDANYLRCLDWLCQPDHTEAVRVGIASHNLFDLAWAALLVADRGVAKHVEFEMLRGIAPAHARAIQSDEHAVLLYTPVVDPEDLDVATAYLFRRLDEAASPENFLRHLFSMRPDSEEFSDQAEAFARSVRRRHAIASGPRRSTAVLPTEHTSGEVEVSTAEPFRNEPDSDPSLPATRHWINEIRRLDVAPPSTPMSGRISEIDHAVHTARQASVAWSARPAAERRAVLHRVAAELRRRRGLLLATMAHEARKTFAEADPEISEAIDFARWYGDRSLELDSLPQTSCTALGAVAVVPPWNFPVAIAAGGVFAALAAGNAVVLKPATETPRCAEIVAEACWAAGVPRDLVHFVRTPDDHLGQHLVTTADAVILTGAWETAQLFRSWKPEIRLFAETSGKNALVITPHCDQDLAVADLVRSAFGHSGQKCSAASLAILVGELAEDDRFLSKLVDAVSSLRIGWPDQAGTTFGPVIAPPTGSLRRALTELEPGEKWILRPEQLDPEGSLWSPGIKSGVAEGSWFHRTECFGPVLGIMRARDLSEAIEFQNAVDYGLTGGIHSLDRAEVDHWLNHVQVGNAYINRHITGAIVQRQPFGGWKRSAIGTGAKAGGFDHLLHLVSWETSTTGDSDSEVLASAAASDEKWWRTWYGVEQDPTGLSCEANVLRYRPRPNIIVRAQSDADPVLLARAVNAARRCGVNPSISVDLPELAGHLPPGQPAVIENEAELIQRLGDVRFGRIRLVGSSSPALAQATASAEVDLVDDPVTCNGRLELRWYLREQSISRTTHRFGIPV